MKRNNEGQWVDGGGASATSHLQVRCNRAIMEMACHYIDQLCGDGTPPKETVMTARQRVDKETGELLEPKQTIVKKYSFTYAMAWKRLSNGLGLVSRADRDAMRVLGTLIASARLVHPPVTISDESVNELDRWRSRLHDAFLRLERGSRPIYLTDILRCSNIQLQAAFGRLRPAPGGVLRYDVDGLRKHLADLRAEANAAYHEAESAGEKFSEEKWWWQAGYMPYDGHFNIRRTNRYIADGEDSETVREVLEFIYDVPSISTPMDVAAIRQDVEGANTIIKAIRKFRSVRKRTNAEKEVIAKELENFVRNLSTNNDGFIAAMKE